MSVNQAHHPIVTVDIGSTGMIKIRLAVVALLASILMLSTGSLAHAADPIEPVTTPTPTQSIAPDDDSLDPGDNRTAPDDDNALAPDSNGVLPGTGGASVYILLIGGALLVVGGGIVYSSSRRQNAF